MHVSARTDYALRAVVELAQSGETPMKREQIASAQEIPVAFLENILLQLKSAGIVQSQRGSTGGYRLGRPATDISLADVIRAIDGPMAYVRGERPESIDYIGPAATLKPVWIAVRASLRSILESVSLQDVVDGRLPDHVRALTEVPDAWVSVGRVRGVGQPSTAGESS